MARGKKKETILTPEEKLGQALVPESEWPYKVPRNWKWVRFEVLKTEPNGFFDGDWILSENMDSEGEVRLLQLSDIGIGEFLDKSDKHISKNTFLKLGCTPLLEGDVMISRMAEPIARSCIVPSFPYTVITAVDVAVLRGNPSIIFNHYLNYLCNAKWFTDLAFSMARGTTRVRITRKNLGQMPFPLPPLPEQQRIVDRIESLFAKLDEAKEKAQLVVDGFEDRKAAILHKAFTGELTEGWRGDHNISIATWNNVKLSEACKINPPKINVKALPDNLEVSFFPMPALSEIYGAITEPQTRLLSDVRTGFTNFSEGDVVFAKITPCMENGKSAVIGSLVNNIGFGTTEFFVLRCNDRLYNRFLWHLVRDRCFRNEAKAVMTGAVGQQRVPKSFLENYYIALPSVEEQKEIVRILDKCFEKELQVKEASEQVIAQIDTIKKSILARAFRGELGTNDPSDESAEELLKRIL